MSCLQTERERERKNLSTHWYSEACSVSLTRGKCTQYPSYFVESVNEGD